MKTLSVIKMLFFLIGIILLGVCSFFSINTLKFLDKATLSKGIVISQNYSQGRSYPIVEFKDKYGSKRRFQSSIGTSPALYEKGDRIDVLYLPWVNNSAKINSFLSLWFFPLLTGILGFIFFDIGLGMFITQWVKMKKKAYLLRYGLKIETKIIAIRENRRILVNNTHPFKIYSQGCFNDKTYSFTSDNIWSYPIECLSNTTIAVYIDKNNPKKYYVDIDEDPRAGRSILTDT
jgi:Protein of unknown function (DUF3592)